jgi:alcohol dehydrogenase class IV
MKYAADINEQKVKIVGEAMGIRFSGQESPKEIGELVAQGIREFAKNLDIKSFEELGISRKELLEITPLVFKDACYNFVPKELTNAEVEVILGNMYDNYK